MRHSPACLQLLRSRATSQIKPRLSVQRIGCYVITIERLPDADFDSLLKVDDGYRPDPASSIAIVAKNDKEIVGRMLLLSLAHIEGTWIQPEIRRGSILVKLMREMEKQAKLLGLKTLFAYSENEEVDDYLMRLGYKKTPLTIFEKEIR